MHSQHDPLRVDPHASVLSYEQLYHFLEEGYVKVSGLISKAIAARADAAMFRLQGISLSDPATWKNARRDTFTTDLDVMAMYTPAVLRAAGQIASVDPHLFPDSRIPENAYVLAIPPTDEPWHDTGGHFDGGGDLKVNIVCSFPQPWRMFAMLYLHDVKPRGGATLVWPQSHRKLYALLRSRPERYRFLGMLKQDETSVVLGDPIEIPTEAGDVIFLDQMMYHAGSTNAGQRPRFAMNMKW